MKRRTTTRGFDVDYRRIYTMLKAHGHDAAKVIEIILDAKRGDKFSMKWIRTLRSIAP